MKSMLQLLQIKGVIFDLDDTLLDNGPAGKPAEWLHSRSRLAAAHAVGKEHNIKALQDLTPEANASMFLTAKVHSLPGASWNILYTQGLVESEDIDVNSPMYPLLLELVARHHELHEAILRKYGREVPGASAFVKYLASHGFRDKLALATSSFRQDIDIFLEKYELGNCFPEERIISYEKVTRPKPDPECFDLAFRSLGLSDDQRRQVLAFEDNPRGLLSAKAAGLYTCALTTRYGRDAPELHATKPDMIADSFAEYRALLGIAPE